MAHKYDDKFMGYAAVSSAHAAERISGLLGEKLAITGVLDVGCAHGTWLKAWKQAGVAEIHGIDGAYVDVANLEIAREHFTPHDLNTPFELGRKFDLVQSLEVGEHVSPAAAADFVASIARHARKFVLFSAAPPGQGGEYHVNEQPYEFWRDALAKHGFETFDWIRPLIAEDPRVSYWYRYNVFLHVRRELVADLPAEIARTRISAGAPLADVSPPVFKLRKAIVRRLPYRVQHEIARLKAWALPTGRI